jgi:hypothetical protein
MDDLNDHLPDDPGDEWVARRLAIKAARREAWEYRPVKPRPILTGIRHGEYGFQKGCGCPVCREGRRVAQAAQRARQKARIAAEVAAAA